MLLHQCIVDAWQQRASLHQTPQLDAYRVFHGWAEGCPGLAIDRYGEVITIEHRASVRDQLPEVVAALDACQRFEHIVVRPRGAAPFAWRGHPATMTSPSQTPQHVVHEHGLRFLIDPMRPGNPGLFLDARPARQWIRRNSQDRRVLNLFAFTGSLGVAAASGGARAVVHVDSARSALDACRANHVCNELPIDARDLARMNIYQHLRRQSAGRLRCGGIIVDAPPLAGLALRSDRTPGGRGLFALVPLAARMLVAGGWMLCFFHHDERDRDQLERAVQDAAGAPLDVLWRGESGPDFPELVPHRKLRLTAFVRTT